MSNPSKAKGSAAERDVAGLVSSGLGVVCERNLEQARGNKTADVVFVFGGETYLLEVKRRESMSRGAWMKQAIEHADRLGHGMPLVVYRKNRQRWRAYFATKLGMMDCDFKGWLGELRGRL